MSRQVKSVTILGATGSIGKSTLDVIARHPDRYRVFALTAHGNATALAALCRQFNPRYAVLPTPQLAEMLTADLASAAGQTEVLVGESALETVASHAQTDIVMAAIVGAAGLKPTLAAAHAGKKVLLANKEALVMSGDLFMRAVRENGATLLPIDSEHNAIFQSLPQARSGPLAADGVRKILLTASGGPFRARPIETLHSVTPDEACAHPNWVMGRKISVDSATMMNKGLEVIEAHWLFDAPAEDIEVVIHPQSVVHSMVSYSDGSVIAQLGNPDMRTPIAYGLAYPERIDAGVAPLDLAKVATLQFEALDTDRFPCVRLAYEAMRRGGTAAATLNAANEVAVEAFLAGKLAFTRIAPLIEDVINAQPVADAASLDIVLAADASARACAHRLLGA